MSLSRANLFDFVPEASQEACGVIVHAVLYLRIRQFLRRAMQDIVIGVRVLIRHIHDRIRWYFLLEEGLESCFVDGPFWLTQQGDRITIALRELFRQGDAVLCARDAGGQQYLHLFSMIECM